MGLTQTTLNGAIKLGDQQLVLTAYTAPSLGTGVNSGNKMLRVDGEWMRIVDDSLTPTLRVTRGELGTVAAAHNTLATAVYGLSTDATQDNDVKGANVASYGVSGAITVPTGPSGIEFLVFLNKATAAAMTLVAPNLDQDGQILVITSNTAAAHTVTATNLLSTGTANVSVATFAAQKGSGLKIEAARGLWNVISATGITFS